MTENAAIVPVDWIAPYWATLPAALPTLDTARSGTEWRALGQHWRRGDEEPFLRGAWARILWNEEALLFEAVCVGGNCANSARTLNERTWESGDVCEIFLQAAGSERYIELHVTPENCRLQLQWDPGTFAAFKSGSSPLEKFMLSDPAWSATQTKRADDHWSIKAVLPRAAVNPHALAFTRSTTWRAAVCRYDCGTQAASPVLSSTARLQAPLFHRPEEWHRLVLAA